MQRKTSEYSALLKTHQLKTTPARLSILSLLSDKHLLSIDELFLHLKRKTDWSTIYRTVQSLERVGIVRPIWMNDGIKRFELNDHHHHIECTQCGRLTEIDSCSIEKLERKLKKMGFENIQHRLEFSGVCQPCARSS